MRACFFGAWDPAYPRNRILREGLRRAGGEVIEVRTRARRALRRWPELAFGFLRAGRDADVIVVPEFRHKDVPLAHRLKRGRRLVFDPLVSRYDTLVRDWKLHREGSPQARWNLELDRWSLSLADAVLCDTWAHGALYHALGVRRERLFRVLVGAEDAFFSVAPPAASGPLRIVYVGGFLPLHGTPVIVEAIARLEREAKRLPEFRVEMVGTGIEWKVARGLAERAKLERIDFPGRTDYADSPRVIAEAHILLGAFGAGAKAGRVIPHKVYQGVAAGRAVITGAGAGLAEVFESGTHLLAVPRNDAVSLAEALATLLREPSTRERLAACGRGRALEVATPEKVGVRFRDALEGVGGGLPGNAA